MIITKKRHKREMEELKKKLETDHSVRLACVESRRHEDRERMRDFMDRVKLYRTRHGENLLADGKSHSYTIAVEISMEMMHYALGGENRAARMVADEIRESAHLALIALCHVDQPPIVWTEPA